MGYFREHTPQEELLIEADVIRRIYQLTDEELLIVLVEVMRACIDPGGEKVQQIGDAAWAKEQAERKGDD